VSAFIPLRLSREHDLEGLDISQQGDALDQNHPPKYLFTALLVGMIMSGVCHDYTLSRHDETLRATEWRMAARFR
jgi:hypothetical protein